MKSTIRVLHIFKNYLTTEENWAFRLIDHLPDAEVVIASRLFLRCNFYPSKFDYLKFPLGKFENPNRVLWLRAVNMILAVSLKFYPLYVQKKCGRCDLMHSHFAPVGWQYMNLAKRLDIPHVVSFYGFDYESLPFCQPVWKRRYNQLFQEANLFLCEGAHGARTLQNIGCPPEKIRVARLGVDVDHIPFWRRKKKPGELHLLQIATLTEKKGHKYSTEAFLIALQDCPNMTLTFVGGQKDQGLKEMLQKKIRDTPAQDKISFMQPITLDLLYDFFKDYHVFIHPSCYTDQMGCEGGAPVVLLDAQATGLPIISTTHCDIPDEVIHGKTGLLSPEKDSISLAGSIKRFYEMGQREYNQFAQNSRKHVQTNYNVRMKSKNLRKIYDDLLLNQGS